MFTSRANHGVKSCCSCSQTSRSATFAKRPSGSILMLMRRPRRFFGASFRRASPRQQTTGFRAEREKPSTAFESHRRRSGLISGGPVFGSFDHAGTRPHRIIDSSRLFPSWRTTALRRGDVVAGGQFRFTQQLEDFDQVTGWRSEREAATHAGILLCGQRSRRCSRAPRQERGCPGPEAFRSRHAILAEFTLP